ncbi:MAG: outer membrane protein [Xanthobacteraceae bacterium]
MSLAMMAGASAADVPAAYPAPIPVAVRVPPPVFNWTGCYLGLNAGFGWGSNNVVDPNPNGIPTPLNTGTDAESGGVGGSQVGCDFQAGSFVFGVQGMFDGAGIAGSHLYGGAGTETLGTNTSWFGTVTGRIGYAVVPSALLYLKGGVAFVHDHFTDSDPAFLSFGDADTTQLGWTIGGGLEYAFLSRWSLFVEYAYYDLGKFNAALNYGSGFMYTYNEKQTLQTVLFGVNFRFGGPIESRY